jgi:hypothetical protein
MTFQQFAEMVREFRAKLTPAQAHLASEGLAWIGLVDPPHGAILETALQMAWEGPKSAQWQCPQRRAAAARPLNNACV